MLSVFADEPELDIQDLYVYSSIVSSTTPGFEVEIPQQGQITDRSITNNLNQGYSKIKNFSFTCPANSYFLIDFDIVAYDGNNLAPNQVPSCSGSRNIVNYVQSDFTVSGSNGAPTIYRAEVVNYASQNGAGQFVHFSIFGVNDALDANNIAISYRNPVTITSSLITPTGNFFNQKITNVNCKTSVSLDTISNLVEEISTSLNLMYFEIVSIGDTLGNFYNEFNQYWETLNTYIYNLWDQYWKSAYPFYDGVTYDANGVGTLNALASRRFGFGVANSLKTIIQLMAHQMEWENKAAESGANDVYDDLNDSASFGSLSDFAGAGSAASWSSGSFSSGLDGIWDFFSNDTFYDLDTTDMRHDREVYFDYFYYDSIDDYIDKVGDDYDPTSD